MTHGLSKIPCIRFRLGKMMLRSYFVSSVLVVCVLAAASMALRAQAPAGGGAPALTPLPMPEILKRYQPISAERLKNPPDGEWPMIRRTYDGWGYSPLSQIDTGNVRRLQPAWVFSTSMENGHE